MRQHLRTIFSMSPICHPQIAYGASNNLVHPATGYMVNRAIAEAPELAKGIANALRAGRTVEGDSLPEPFLAPFARFVCQNLFMIRYEVQ